MYNNGLLSATLWIKYNKRYEILYDHSGSDVNLVNRTHEEKSKEKGKRRGEGLAEEINKRKPS